MKQLLNICVNFFFLLLCKKSLNFNDISCSSREEWTTNCLHPENQVLFERHFSPALFISAQVFFQQPESVKSKPPWNPPELHTSSSSLEPLGSHSQICFLSSEKRLNNLPKATCKSKAQFSGPECEKHPVTFSPAAGNTCLQLLVYEESRREPKRPLETTIPSRLSVIRVTHAHFRSWECGPEMRLLTEENGRSPAAAGRVQAVCYGTRAGERKTSLQRVPGLHGGSTAAEQAADEAGLPAARTPWAFSPGLEARPSPECLPPELGGHRAGGELLQGLRPKPHRVPHRGGASRPRPGPSPPGGERRSRLRVLRAWAVILL